MNVQRFVGKNARQAMAQARAACGEQALVLANRPVPGGVEILALPASDLPHQPAAHGAATTTLTGAQPAQMGTAAARRQAPMSTISFQAYVQERAQRAAAAAAAPAATHGPAAPPDGAQPVAPVEPGRFAREDLALAAHPAAPPRIRPGSTGHGGDTHEQVMAELRALRGSVTRQLAGMAWFDTARRDPAQTALLRLLLANGFSPGLARKLVDKAPADIDAARAEDWLASMLAHNLRTSTEDDTVLARGGVWALVGPTGVGKTTTTAKLAARFAHQHGAASVGLITVDTYRMAGADQLRAFGRLLNIPVHTARDASSLADLLQLFAAKKLVLVDTVGLAQRDRRLPELFAALPAAYIGRLLVLQAGQAGEALEQVAQAYSAGPGTRCVIGKLDEAPGCGAVLDVALRHRLVVEGLATGQRVPEDWHPAQAPLLARKGLMARGGSYEPDEMDLGLLLTAPARPGAHAAGHA